MKESTEAVELRCASRAVYLLLKERGGFFFTAGWANLLLPPHPDTCFSSSLQVNDFLSGRSPLTLALRVGDHMMFVQLQLAAQQNGGQVQHRHVITSRGEPASAGTATTPVPAAGPATSNCRTFHGGSSGSSPAASFARVPVVPACQQNPASSPTAPSSSAPTTPMYCNAAHPTPVTAGMFRSHGASAQAVGSNGVVSSCSEVSAGLIGLNYSIEVVNKSWGGLAWSGLERSHLSSISFFSSLSPHPGKGALLLPWILLGSSAITGW